MTKDKDKDKTIKFYLSLVIAILSFIALMRYSLIHLNKLKIDYHAPNLSLAKVFTNNMLLQRNQNIMIWGKAHSGKEIKITFKDKHYIGKSDPKDNWKINLGDYDAGGPYEIKIASDKEEIILENVLIGDQWLVLGEAIVNFPLSQTNDFSKEITAIEKLPDIRYYNADLLPQEGHFRELNQEALWQIVKPENVTDLPAISYYLAKALSKSSQVPIGIIKVAEDYVPVEALLSQKALSKFPEFQAAFDNDGGAVAEKEGDSTDVKMEHHYKALFDTELGSNASQMLKLTIDKISEGDITLFINEELIGKIKETNNLRVFNIPALLLKPKYNKIELRITNVDDMVQLSRDQMNLRVYLSSGAKSETIFKPGYEWHYVKTPDITVPGLIFKEMIQPLLSMKFKGIVVYQGDSNLNNPSQYKDLLTALIKDIQSHYADAKLLFLGLRNISAYNPDFANADNLKAIQQQVMTSAEVKFINTNDLEFKTSAEAIAARCL